MTASLEKNNDIIFSLDIGTRTIIGMVAKYEDEKLNIIASEILSHEKRAMYDGQIHDIASVVKIANQVKESLEEQIGFTLDKVAIAAAGRSLKVSRAKITIKVDNTREIDRSTIKSAELEAVQEAEKMLKEKENIEEKKYYCVGHTVINYFLDDILIENLEGHKGENITIDLIATFLPHTVVDSLNTVMNRLSLEVMNMTLEPIAAINIAVKKNLRLLNIALVDVGAGTSDIAISKEGTIASYAMVPKAGDAITESLVKEYLLDYDIAERVKMNLSQEEEHEFKDIIGIDYKLSSEQILDKIDYSIKELSDEISEKILELNGSSPSVVFLIGGGSQIPRLDKYIGENLGIPLERVTIKDTSLLENVQGIKSDISGPDAITPVGIAMMALENNYQDSLQVSLNGEKIKLLNVENSKITDVLLVSGFNPRNLLSKRGKSLNYYLNDSEKSVLGQVGEPAKVYLNGKLSNLEQKLKNKDEIVIEDASVGQDATLRLFDVINLEKIISLDDDEYNLMLEVFLNEKESVENCDIEENDKIRTREITNLDDLYKHLNIDQEKTSILKDGEVLSLEYVLQAGDKLTTADKKKKEGRPDITQQSQKKTIHLIINDERKSIDYSKDTFQFVDVFDHIDFNLREAKGNLNLKVNGEEAEYLQKLNNGDIIKIYWES